MARRAEPDYVSGVRGRYEISPPIVHPARCVCLICPRHRKTNADWFVPMTIRARRKSPYPDSRPASAGYSMQFKREEEARLVAAVEEAQRQKLARANAVPFGRVVDAYRNHQQAEGKRYDRDRYRIDAAESFFRKDRDAMSIDREAYTAYKAHLAKEGVSAATMIRHTTVLVAMMNHAVREGLLPKHNLVLLQRPKSKKKTRPITFSRQQVAVLLGRAMNVYEQEQAKALHEWSLQQAPKGLTAQEMKRREYERTKARKAGEDLPWRTKEPSTVPLRGFCLIAYLTLMRPENNFNLSWEQLRLDAKKDVGRFRLEEHKNSSKGIDVEGGLHPVLVRYLRQIWPGRGAAGLVHPNPATGAAYVNIRRQWGRLVEIANDMLPADEQLVGKGAEFYTWRHTGASALAANGADPVMIVRMMGDTSLKTVMDHYFDSSVEHMQEILARWEQPITWKAAKEEESQWTN